MEKNKTRLIRFNYDGRSLFSIKADSVDTVWDAEGNKLKFSYDVPSQVLTIFGDHEGIYVHYFLEN